MPGQIGEVEGAITRGANTVSSTREDLSSRINLIESQMLSIGSSWQGMGAMAFQRLMVQWKESSAKVNQALLGLENALRVTHADLVNAEQEHESGFSHLAARLG